jgi:hypothetical protein
MQGTEIVKGTTSVVRTTVEERRFSAAQSAILLITGHWPLPTAFPLVENESLTPAPSPSLLRIQPMVFPS